MLKDCGNSDDWMENWSNAISEVVNLTYVNPMSFEKTEMAKRHPK